MSRILFIEFYNNIKYVIEVVCTFKKDKQILQIVLMAIYINEMLNIAIILNEIDKMLLWVIQYGLNIWTNVEVQI